MGKDISWEKVSEIYKLGLKHGMKLSAISGLEGVLKHDDFVRVRIWQTSPAVRPAKPCPGD
ncbi:MAG: hypothetical protein R2860_03750 [Desulfobacterales bacterium]